MDHFHNRQFKFFCVFTISFIWLLCAASSSGSEGTFLPGSDVPLIQGGVIIKSKQFQGSGRYELETGIPPDEAVEFYHRVMQEKGWPMGQVMSTGNRSVLMIMDQGGMVTVKAEKKENKTSITVAIVKRSSIKAAMKKQAALSSGKAVAPASEKTDQVIPQHGGKTIEGSPHQKGDFIKRLPEMNDEEGAPFQKKDNGNLPEDSSPEPAPDKPEPEDPSDEDPPDEDSSGGAAGAEQGSQDGIPDILTVAAQITANWKVITPEYHRYEGIITMQINGNMKKDNSASPSVNKGNHIFVPSLTYRPEGMTLTYTYKEKRTTLKKIPEGNCQDPVMEEFHGGGTALVSDKSVLRIHRFTSMAAPYLQNLSPDKQQFLASIKGSMTIPDYYELFVGGPASEKRVQGRKKISSKKECKYKEVDKSLRGCSIGVQMELPESGIMSGSRNWSADDQGQCPPAMKVFVSDIASILKKQPLKPPNGGNRNVTYNVSWRIGQAVSGTGPDSPQSEPEENTSNPCPHVQNRLKNIDRIRSLYLNDRVREYIKNHEGENNWGAYQQGLENIFKSIVDDYNLRSMDGSEIENWLNSLDDSQLNEHINYDRPSAEDASKLYYNDMNDFPCSTDTGEQNTEVATFMVTNPTNHTIDSMVDGKSVPIIEYDQAWGNPTPTEHYATVYKNFMKKYGEKAGEARFQAALSHEMTHADQFRDWVKEHNTPGPIDIDTKSIWEQEAYEIERKVLEHFKVIFGC